MKIKLKNGSTGEIVDAVIREAKHTELPSIHNGWRFNFNKHAKLPNAKAYVITLGKSPTTIEGCLIFQMQNKTVPYMAFVEKAPHHKGKNSKLKLITECLIAFACRLSFLKGKEHYKGWLAFDVCEERELDSIKLMSVYSQKYRAMRFGETRMLISPDDGEALVKEYLKGND